MDKEKVLAKEVNDLIFAFLTTLSVMFKRKVEDSFTGAEVKMFASGVGAGLIMANVKPEYANLLTEEFVKKVITKDDKK